MDKSQKEILSEVREATLCCMLESESDFKTISNSKTSSGFKTDNSQVVKAHLQQFEDMREYCNLRGLDRFGFPWSKQEISDDVYQVVIDQLQEKYKNVDYNNRYIFWE